MMGKVTREEIVKLAKLAKLELKEGEIGKLTTDLDKIIDYISAIGEVDTTHIKSKLWATKPQNVSREDKINPLGGLSVESAIANAKNTKNNLFVVAKVLNKEKT